MTSAALPPPVRDRVAAVIARSPVVLFALGPARAPRTGVGARVLGHLKDADVLTNTDVVDLVEDRELREAVQVWADSSDLPLLFAHGAFVGGAHAIDALAASGSLARTLAPVTRAR